MRSVDTDIFATCICNAPVDRTAIFESFFEPEARSLAEACHETFHHFLWQIEEICRIYGERDFV